MTHAVSRQSILTEVTKTLGFQNRIQPFLVDPNSDPWFPLDLSEYRSYREYMHELAVHALLDANLYENSSFKLDILSIKTNSNKLNRQCPDLYTLDREEVLLGEVAVTNNLELVRKKKSTKYDELKEVLTRNGYSVAYNVHIIDMTNPEWPFAFPQISNLHREMLDEMIENLRLIHADPQFSEYSKNEKASQFVEGMNFNYPKEVFQEKIYEAIGERESFKKTEFRLTNGGKEVVEDKAYINGLAKAILRAKPIRRPEPRNNPVDPVEFSKDWEEFKSKPATKLKLPKILQLGAPSILFEEIQTDFSRHLVVLRTTKFFGGYLDLIKASLQIENPDEDSNIISLSLSTEELEREQMQGPGRKSLLKKKGLLMEREEPVHIGVKPEHITKLYNLSDKIKSLPEPELLETTLPELDTVGLTMYVQLKKLTEFFSTDRVNAVLKFYQRLSIEITINSMRRRKSGQYVIGFSGFRGVYFLIAPGPQLRTESNTEFVKMISFVPPISDELSAEWETVGNHWESKWLSVDTNRLKHWQRSSDRCQLSCLANVERLVEPGLPFQSCLTQEVTNENHFLLAMTYLEDKQLTSVTNQTIRYLWIKSLGDKDLNGLMSKFPSRVNSVIQSTMLQRSVEWAIKMCNSKLSDLVEMPSVQKNSETGNYDESTTGVVGKIPRLFTQGDNVPISYNLNEIYWCMAYNKDRQNATQDALGILGKIFKEERKFEDESAKRETPESKLDYLFGTTTLQDDINHATSENPESHFFSMRAVLTGMRLQDTHEHNFGANGSWKTSEKLTSIFNLNLSEFATFKASVKEISQEINPTDLKEVEKLGCRTKAIELVAELVKSERLLTSMDVLMQFSGDQSMNFQVFIQIFKKGQIGGVREIIILYIKARVLFRLTEDIAKLLSKADKREILTKGRDKRHMMRGDFEELMASFPEGTNVRMIKNSYDMTTWAQKFIPTIFMAIGETHFKEFTPIRDLYRMLFMAHVNKKIEYPKKLVEQWIKHPDKKHEDNKYMQKMKEKLLRDGVPYFRNKSNMCQGIPHYSSSVLALSCQSLRDALFKECLEILGQEKHIAWRTRVGSDDKGDLIALDTSTPLSYLQYKTFEQCAAWSEKLHSMELSIKSASGNVIYELNSAFMSNLEILSPTIKFTMAAADCIGTTSCTSFVNESYTRIRQMRENGCSSLLTGMAHMLNSDHFYWIFDTRYNGSNSPEKAFSQPSEEIPYDFGIYPFYDIDLQDMIGPEFHNYVACVIKGPNKPACKLLFSEINDGETTEFLEEEGMLSLFKKDHFGIRQGLVKQLAGMRRRVGTDPEAIKKFFEDNPFLLVRGPETLSETENMICSKLHTKGASESLRRTSPAIYIGRLAAYRSAKAWSVKSKVANFVVDTDNGTREIVYHDELVTYQEFLKRSISLVKDSTFNINEVQQLVFPQSDSFEVVRSFVGMFGPLRTTDKKYSQAVRTWTTNTYNYEFTSSIKSILETSTGMAQSTSREEVAEMKKLLNFELKSIEQISEECREKGIRPLDLYFYMTKILKACGLKKAQVFASGPSSSSTHMTAINIKKYNHLPGMTMSLEAGVSVDALAEESRMDNKVDMLKLYTNLKLMSHYSSTASGKFVDYTVGCSVNERTLIDWCETIVRSVKTIRSFDRTTQKVFRFVASQILTKAEFKEKLTSWRVLNYSYVKKQKRTVSERGRISWSGPLRVLVNSGHECYEIYDDGSGLPKLFSKKIVELDTFYLSLKEMSRILDIPMPKFFKTRNIRPGEVYQSDNKRMLVRALRRTLGTKEKLNIELTEQFRYKSLTDFNSFTVNTAYDSKTGSLEVFLGDGRDRSATICHFTGSLFHMPVPHNIRFSDEMFLGVRMSYVLKNRDFFSNGRMPMAENKEALKDIRENIDWKVFGKQKEMTANRIQTYLEVREEVNEEAFNLGDLMSAEVVFKRDNEIEQYTGENLMEMFQNTMDQITHNFFGSMTLADWADYEDEEDGGSKVILEEDFEEKMEENEGNLLGVMRSIGYKRPTRRMNFGQISLLQLGSVMLTSALDRFFNSGSILRESKKDLPGYYVWLNHYSRQTEGDNAEFSILRDLLMKYIILILDKTYGFPQSGTEKLLRTRGSHLGKPISTFASLMEGLDITTGDLIDTLFQAQEEGLMDDSSEPESDNNSEMSD